MAPYIGEGDAFALLLDFHNYFELVMDIIRKIWVKK
jgi:hypothetical protein